MLKGSRIHVEPAVMLGYHERITLGDSIVRNKVTARCCKRIGEQWRIRGRNGSNLTALI